MIKSYKNISIKDLAAIVCQQLKQYSIDAVLTGGACVSIYTKNKYLSHDLDFVSGAVELLGKKIKAAMEEIGFYLNPQNYFANPQCKFFIEFIPSPLAIGKELVKKVKRLPTRRGTIKMLTPTDSVKDRLAAYFYWNDKQSFEQALMIAEKNRINLANIKKWAQKEKQTKKLKDFTYTLSSRRSNKSL